MRDVLNRFWSLRWRWKAPILALAFIVVLGIVAPTPEEAPAEESNPQVTGAVSGTDGGGPDATPTPQVTPTPAPNDETPLRRDEQATPTPTTATESAGARAPPPTGDLRVTFLDVGQGDATLLQAPDATMLIDAGRHDRTDVVPHLRSLGVQTIDVIVITHAHADHIGQLDRVLQAFPVAEVWMSGTPHTTQTYQRAVAAIEASDVLYEEPRAGSVTTVGALRVEIVNPVSLTGDLHADSLSMRVTYGDVSFLFTGDAEAQTEASMVQRHGEILRAQIYQVGHHGSRTSTTAGFLAAVAPEVAIYSASEGNQYGHPHVEVLQRMLNAGIEIYGTAVHGSVTVTTDGSTRNVATQAGGGPIAAAPTATPIPAQATPTPVPPVATPQATPTPAPPATCGPGTVDINSADFAALQQIIHIGPDRAQQIVQLRPFRSVDALTRVSGIGPARLADIKSQGVACAG